MARRWSAARRGTREHELPTDLACARAMSFFATPARLDGAHALS